MFKSERGPIVNVRTTDINQDCSGQSDRWQLIHRAFISLRQSTDKKFDDHWLGCVKTLEIYAGASGRLVASAEKRADWPSSQPPASPFIWDCLQSPSRVTSLWHTFLPR